MSGREGRRERKRCWRGGRDGQSDQRQNCGCSMCTIKRGRCHIFGRHPRVMPCFSVNVDGFGMPLRSSRVSSYACQNSWNTGLDQLNI